MRKVSYALILLTGLIFLIILVLTIAWATFDDEDYRRLAVRSVETFTGYAMAIDGAFSLDLSTRPILSAEGIRLEARDGDPPPSLSKIGKFYVQLDLPQHQWKLNLMRRAARMRRSRARRPGGQRGPANRCDKWRGCQTSRSTAWCGGPLHRRHRRSTRGSSRRTASASPRVQRASAR